MQGLSKEITSEANGTDWKKLSVLEYGENIYPSTYRL